MESVLDDRARVGVPDAILLEDYTSEDAFLNNLVKRYNENIIYVSTTHKRKKSIWDFFLNFVYHSLSNV